MADLTPEMLAQLERAAAKFSGSTFEWRGDLGWLVADPNDGTEPYEISDSIEQYVAEPLAHMLNATAALVAAAKERDQLRAEVAAHDEQIAAIMDGTFAQGDGTAQKEIERLRAEMDRQSNEAAAMMRQLGAEAERVIGSEREKLDAAREALAAHVRALLQVLDRKSYSSAAQQEAVRAAEAAIGGVP